MEEHSIGILVLIICFLSIYFVPTIVAWKKKHKTYKLYSF